MPHHRGARFVSEEDADDDDEGTVTYSRSSSSASLRSRLMVTKVCEPKTITTTPGLLGAGETETESEDQPVCAQLAFTPQYKSFVNYNSCGSSPPPVSSRPPGHSSLRPLCNSVLLRYSFPFHVGFRLFPLSLELCTTSSLPYFPLNNRPAIVSTSSFRSYG
jgi:hypothetical protein